MVTVTLQGAWAQQLPYPESANMTLTRAIPMLQTRGDMDLQEIIM